MFELYFPSCFTNVFECDFLLMLLSTLDKAQIDKGLKDNLTFGPIDSDGQLGNSALITEDLNNLSLIFQFLAVELDFSRHRQPRRYFRLHCIMNREVLVGALIDSNSLRLVSEVPDLHCDLIQLVDLDVLEDNLRGNYL